MRFHYLISLIYATFLTFVTATPAPVVVPNPFPSIASDFNSYLSGILYSLTRVTTRSTVVTPTSTILTSSGTTPTSNPASSSTSEISISASATVISATSSVTSSTPPTTAPTSTPTVILNNGPYYGAYLSNFKQDAFLGIPYAHVQRFSPAIPITETWTTPRNATDYGVSCPGIGLDQALFTQAEDCLNLNIVRPAGTTSTSKLPVVVYIFGGAFRTGTASRNIYNGSYPVNTSMQINQPIIYVSINYRINAFGFLSSSEVAGEGVTNLGLKDQRFALHWIKDNIAAFGGNPDSVTLWGQSAGAESVSAQLLAYGGRDDKLFHRAILQSGSPTTLNAYSPGTATYQNAYNALVAKFNCTDVAPDSLECLRNVNFDDLFAAINPANGVINVMWQPVVDGDFIQKYPSVQLAKGQFTKVPVLSGTCNDEGTFFAAYGFNSTGAVAARIKGQFPNLSNNSLAQLQSLYPDDPNQYPLYPGQQPLGNTLNTSYLWNEYGTEYKRLAQILGDLVFIAARRLTARSWTTAGVPYYSYHFAAEPNSYSIGQGIFGPQYGVSHNSDLPYAFNNPTNISLGDWGGQTPADVRLREYMSSSWVAFINTGNPNQIRSRKFNDAGQWTVYDNNNPQNYFLAVDHTNPSNATFVALTEADTWRQDQISFINSETVSFQLNH